MDSGAFLLLEKILVEKLDGFCDCTIASRPKRGERREQAPREGHLGPAAILQPRRYRTARAIRLFFRQGLYITRDSTQEDGNIA
ncbi:hypothetical protein Y032_0049g1774 [Ancylostoma ceylanicum]|uniref:Uncharacterized protein n=1 Tax=Ancylostoma ceylanicum TaxID=53326 RepID=A0A016U9F1_9BILA|nr:hypothetical protein Y032_0049g1774 [Ancylostoma ceylanicum]